MPYINKQIASTRHLPVCDPAPDNARPRGRRREATTRRSTKSLTLSFIHQWRRECKILKMQYEFQRWSQEGSSVVPICKEERSVSRHRGLPLTWTVVGDYKRKPERPVRGSGKPPFGEMGPGHRIVTRSLLKNTRHYHICWQWLPNHVLSLSAVLALNLIKISYNRPTTPY
jgi:hypothetical protein